MIAKVKATGEIIDVEYNDGWIRRTEPQSWIRRDEIEILGYTEEEVKQRIDRAKKDHIEDNLEKVGNPYHIGEATEKVGHILPYRDVTPSVELITPFDESYWRRMYAGMAMQGLVASDKWRRMEMGDRVCVCVEMADALIEELKKEKK